MLHTNWNPGRHELRQFSGIWLPLFVVVLGIVAFYRFDAPRAAITIWIIGLALSALGLVVSAVARTIYVTLMAVAYPIGWLVSHLMLAAIYYLLFLPIGVALRMSGHDPLSRHEKAPQDSYWVRHEPRDDAASYFRQF